MNNHKLSEPYYQTFATHIANYMCFSWKKVLVYFEADKGFISVNFRVQDIQKSEYLTSTQILSDYSIKKDIEDLFFDDLISTAEKLREALLSEGNTAWSTLTFILNNDGSFSVDYGYDDLFSISKAERRKNWSDKYLI